tara:strand:+ start:4066 stop:4494 length:429 start_codon:yes stop_codon:yes gene_type:complete
MKITKERLIEIIKEELEESIRDDTIAYELADEEPWADRKRSRASMVAPSKPAAPTEDEQWQKAWRWDANVPRDFAIEHPNHPERGDMTLDQHMTLALSPQYGFSGSRKYINALKDKLDVDKNNPVGRAFAEKLDDKVDKYYG